MFSILDSVLNENDPDLEVSRSWAHILVRCVAIGWYVHIWLILTNPVTCNITYRTRPINNHFRVVSQLISTRLSKQRNLHFVHWSLLMNIENDLNIPPDEEPLSKKISRIATQFLVPVLLPVSSAFIGKQNVHQIWYHVRISLKSWSSSHQDMSDSIMWPTPTKPGIRVINFVTFSTFYIKWTTSN